MSIAFKEIALGGYKRILLLLPKFKIFFETPLLELKEKFMSQARKSILLHCFHTSFFSPNIT